MSTAVVPAAGVDVHDDTDKRLTLHARFLQAAFADTSLLRDIPSDVMLVLLPDDDAAYVAREVARAAHAAQRGDNVYLRHVRVADLPDLPEPSRPIGTEPGTRRATYDPDTGDVLTNQVLGDDGEWHDTDEPLPTPRDDESDPRFRF